MSSYNRLWNDARGQPFRYGQRRRIDDVPSRTRIVASMAVRGAISAQRTRAKSHKARGAHT
jgi:hypothetical protein